MKYCSLITVVCFALINPEVASSQDWPPLQNTKGVGPPLICPSSFQLKGIVSPQGGGCASWSDHLKPPQGQPRLAPHCTHSLHILESTMWMSIINVYDRCPINMNMMDVHHLWIWWMSIIYEWDECPSCMTYAHIEFWMPVIYVWWMSIIFDVLQS